MATSRKILIAISLLLSVLIYFAVSNVLMNLDVTHYTGQPTILLKARIKQTDVFTVFYKLAKSEKYSGSHAIRLDVEGQENYQLLAFKLPKSKVEGLRVDLGIQEGQDSLEIESIGIHFSGYDVKYMTSSLDTLFRANQFVSTDFISGKYKLKVKKNKKYDPFIVANENFVANYNAIASKKITVPYANLVALILSTALFIYLYHRSKSIPVIAHSKSEFVITAIFLVLILAPFIDEHFNIDDGKSLENRRMTNKPEINFDNLEDYPKRFATYYSDSFGFRNYLVNLGSLIKASWFNSVSSNDVVIGKNNWVFLGKAFKLYDDYTRQNLYSDEELIKKVKILEKRKKNLAKQDISFYKVYYPNKHSIYEEYLPARMRVQKLDTATRTEQLIAFLEKRDSPVEIIDVKNTLLKRKDSVQLYLKDDSHWNSFGAFFAYQELFNTIAVKHPDLKPINIKEFEVIWKIKGDGGHYKLLGVRDKEFFVDNKPTFISKNKVNIIEKNTEGYPLKTVIHENLNAKNDMVAIVFRDSFTNALIPFISPHFKRTIYIWKPFSDKIVSKEKPDIVIEGFVERYFQ